MEDKQQNETENSVNILDLPKHLQDELESMIHPTKMELFLALKDIVNALNSNDGEIVNKSLYRSSLAVTIVSVDMARELEGHENLLMKRIGTLSKEIAKPMIANALKDTENLVWDERIHVLHEALGAQMDAIRKAQAKVELD